MKERIQQFFEISTPEIELAVDLITGIYASRGVSSTSLAKYVRGGAETASKQRRIERFYSEGYVDPESLIDAIREMFVEKKFKLSLDRTNWKFGKNDLNAFAAFASSGNTGSLINLKMLDNKGGNSCSDDRIEIIEGVVKQYGKDSILSILGDREFYSLKFAAWLKSEGIGFAIRVRENLDFVQPYLKGATFKGKTFKDVIVGIYKKVEVRCDLSIKKLKDEYLIIVSSRVARPLEEYRGRWGIERFFKMLKTGGFNIESTKITDPDRLEILFLLCSMAYLICIKMGIYRHQHIKKIRKKSRDSCYEYSYFRWGLDWLRELIFPDVNHLTTLLTKVFAYV
jgi:IS4 transposase